MIKKLADRMVEKNDTAWEMNINSFDWVPAVGLYGIYNAYEETGEKKYLDFLVEWTDKHLDDAYKTQTVNSSAPLLTVRKLYNIVQNKHYLDVCTDIAENIINKAPITETGGLEHTVTEDGADFHNQIWADTLFMACLFLLEMGDKKYVKFAENQFLIHNKYLIADDKLYYHGFNGKDHMSGIKWGRANAWILYSNTVLAKTTGDERIASYIRTHAAALRRVQRQDKTFGTILDDPSSYSELSATAGIFAGIKRAVSLGILDKEYLGMCGNDVIEKHINSDGELMNVSTGTPIMKNAEEYKKIPLRPTLYGQGLAILALRDYNS